MFNVELWIETPEANIQWNNIMNSKIIPFTWIYRERACGDILHHKSIKNLQMFSPKVSSHFGITSIFCTSDQRFLLPAAWVSLRTCSHGEKKVKRVSVAHQFLNYTFNEEVTKNKVKVFYIALVLEDLESVRSVQTFLLLISRTWQNKHFTMGTNRLLSTLQWTCGYKLC